MAKATVSLALALLGCIPVAEAELLVYEPFDYATVNDAVFGRLTGRNGGLGFRGAWQGDDAGNAFVYDKQGNPPDLYNGLWGEGSPAWDGVVDNLPTLGGYVGLSDWWRDTPAGGDQLNAVRPLAKSAGEMAAKNGGVLWLSAVWHYRDNGFFAPVGIAFTSGGSFVERARDLTKSSQAIGVGNGNDIRQGELNLNPTFWENGKESAQTFGTNISTKSDNIIILKFEFGATDTVSAWYFTEDQEMTEQAFNENAKSVTSMIDENLLTHLAFSSTRHANAVDEFRIGSRFNDVITGTMAPRQEVEVVKLPYDKKSDRYFLIFKSNPGEVYGLYSADNSAGYHPCIAAAVEAHPTARETPFGPFPNPHPGKSNLAVKIGLPDLEAPSLRRIWGNTNTISINFSEPMMPGPASLTDNYAIEKDGGGKVSISSAAFHPTDDTVVLTTAKPLDLNAAYTVNMHNLTDRAGRSFESSTPAKFRTWDNNPKGVKVFVLAGQSNMVGRGKTDEGMNGEAGALGSLRYHVKSDPTNYGHLVDENQNWKELEGVKFWWNRQDVGTGQRVIKGNLKVGFGAGPDVIGPEFGIGWALDQHHAEPVLLIKTAWGGKDLFTDFRSPSAVARRGGRIGSYYSMMFDQVRQVLGDLDTEFPELAGMGYQIAGFAWHQGWNDNTHPVMTEAYEANLVDFIKDLRAEFGQPGLPFSIGATGHHGAAAKGVIFSQLALADPARHPDLAGTVFSADTRTFWREHTASPTNDASHWNANGESYFLIGDAMGRGLVEMLSR
jgi:hypothetical protein